MSNSEPEPEAEPKVKAEENSDTVVVVDPDDYQKTQKLKAISEAKKEFKEVKRNKTEYVSRLDDRWKNPLEAYRSIRAERLADYGSELMPLIDEAREAKALEESELQCDLGPGYDDIDVTKFVRNDGHIYSKGGIDHPDDSDFGPASQSICNAIYRHFEGIERKLGLGLELELDKGPAEI